MPSAVIPSVSEAIEDITLTGDTTGSVTAGTSSIPTTTSLLTGPVTEVATTSTVNQQVTTLTIGVNSTGTPVNGFGNKIKLLAEDSTSNGQDIGQFGFEWTDVTHATRTSKFTVAPAINGVINNNDIFNVYGSGGASLNADSDPGPGVMNANVGFRISNTAASGTVLIGDGTNFVASTPAFPNSSGASGKFIRSDGTNWVASTPTLPTTAGTNGNYLYSDGTNWVTTPRTINSIQGTSTSGTNGTIVANMTAAAGNYLHNFMAILGQTTTAQTNMRLNIVYSDGTSTTDNSVYQQPVQIFATYGGIMRMQSAQFSALTALSAGKKVTSINVTTMGTGSGTRAATISAEEIPLW